MDSNPHEVAFYNLDGRSYSHVFQVEASYPFFQRIYFDRGCYRLTDAQTTYKGQRMEKPLTSKYKGLLTASYQTPLEYGSLMLRSNSMAEEECLLLMNWRTVSCPGSAATAVSNN